MFISDEVELIKLAKKLKEQTKDTAIGLGIGAVAGAVSTTAVQPISQISNIKSTYGANPNFKGRLDTYKDVVKSIYHGDTAEVAKTVGHYDHGIKGVKNFYKGLGAKLVQTAPQSAILLGLNALLYSAYKKAKRDNQLETNG